MHKICPKPFLSMDCMEGMSPCCPSWLSTNKFNIDIASSSDLNALTIWKDNYSEFRSSILDGSYKYCSETCPNKIALEKNLMPSLEVSNPDIYNKVIKNDSTLYPSTLTLCYDITCNLACKSCRIGILKTDHNKVSQLFNFYSPLLEHTKHLTISGDGDAFASPHYFSLLQSDLTELAPNLERITLQTNGILLNESNFNKIHVNNKKIINFVSVSIDAASEEIYKKTRGGNFNKLCENLHFLKQVKEIHPEWLYLFTSYTINKYNLSDAVKFIDFVYAYNFNMIQFWLVRDWSRGESFDNLSIDINSEEYKNVRSQIHEKIESMKGLIEIKWMISDKNVESSNKKEPQKIMSNIQQTKQLHIHPIINQTFYGDEANTIIKPIDIKLNTSIPTKKYAIYCPFYISNENMGHWITNWITNVALYEDADKYYTLSYPENIDLSKYDDIIQKLNSIATCIKSDYKIYHTHALEIAHDYLKSNNYDYMLHIEQDVILNAPIGNHLINKIVEDNNDVLITDIKGLEIFDGESDIDISIFVINLNNYDSNSYHTYVSSDNIKTFDLLDHTLYNIGEYKTIPPILNNYSNFEIYNSINKLLNYVYNKTNLIHWVHNYMRVIHVDNVVNPVFVDSARGYPIHAYMNNKLSIAFGISSYSKHLKQSRESYIVSRIDKKTIIDRFGYPPIGDISPNEHIKVDAYLSKGLDIVIISKNQKSAIEKMLNVLKFDIPNANRIFVLDRCTDGSKEFLESNGEFFIERHDATGFCAGSARNIGLKHTNPDNDVLFLDGDRIPHNLNYERIVQMLYYFNISMIKNEHDTRKFFVNIPSINTQQHKYNNQVWSSAILLRRSAINKITNIVGNENLFEPEFDGNWGCEDEYLGDIALYLNMLSGGFPNFIYVEGNTTNANMDDETIKHQYAIRNRLRDKLILPVDYTKIKPLTREEQRDNIRKFLKNRER